MNKNVRVRVAPSPTGLLHIGTVRTALYNYLYARHVGGTFVLRLEDTDTVRSEKQYEENILQGLRELGITYDEGPDVGGDFGPYRQSERTELYTKYLTQLVEQGNVYPCYCSVEELEKERLAQQARKEAPRYIGTCRSLTVDERASREAAGTRPTYRFRVPDTMIIFDDLIRGHQEVQAAELGDFIIARAIDSPLFNFAVVIDDVTMEITHVIRGEDHLPNTPKQILIYQALGKTLPVFAHLPLILNPDRSKLSKRKNPVSVSHYIAEGYLPEALINFLALLGWNDGTEQEIFTLEELSHVFSVEKVHKAGAVFDMNKLNWMNGMYIRALAPEALLTKLRSYWTIVPQGTDESYLLKIVTVLRERLERLAQMNELTEFFFARPEYDGALLVPKKGTADRTKFLLTEAQRVLATLPNVEIATTEAALNGIVEAQQAKRGELLWPIRVALSGRAESPGAYELLWVFGLEESLERIGNSIKKLPA